MLIKHHVYFPIYVFSVIAVAMSLAPLALAQPKIEGDLYLLDTCIVSGAKLGSMGEPVIYAHERREIRFCCQGCVPKFQKSPALYLTKLDALIIQDQKPYYPMDKCLVTGGKLGSMGEPIDYVYKNRLVRFCCKGCIPEFQKNARQYLAELNKAVIAKQRPNYPLTTCLVSGEKLGGMGEPVEIVRGNRLLRFCCKGCIPMFQKEPAKYLLLLKQAYEKQKGAHPADIPQPENQEGHKH